MNFPVVLKNKESNEYVWILVDKVLLVEDIQKATVFNNEFTLRDMQESVRCLDDIETEVVPVQIVLAS